MLRRCLSDNNRTTKTSTVHSEMYFADICAFIPNKSCSWQGELHISSPGLSPLARGFIRLWLAMSLLLAVEGNVSFSHSPPPALNQSPIPPSPNPPLIYLILSLIQPNIKLIWQAWLSEIDVMFTLAQLEKHIWAPSIWQYWCGHIEHVIFCEFNTRPHAIFLPRVIGPYIQLHVKDPFNGLTQERKWSGDTADVLIRTSVHLWAVWLRRCYWEAVVCHSCLHMQLWICVFVSEVCMRTWVCMCVCVNE